jgi:hypothetical protein
MTERAFICPVTEAPCDNERCLRDHCRAQADAQQRYAAEAAERRVVERESRMLWGWR